MNTWTWGLAGALVGVFLFAIGLRMTLVDAVDLSDLPGAAGADTVHRVLRGENASWDVWFVHLLLPMTDGEVVAAAHRVALLSGLGMILGAALAGWACAGPAGMLSGSVVASTWSMALMPALLVGPDPPTVGLAWFGLGLAWSGARWGRWGWVLTSFGVTCVVWAIATKPVALPALGLLPMASIWLQLERRERSIQWGVMLFTLLIAWWVFSPDLAQHNGGLEPIGWASPFIGMCALFDMNTTWPDGALHWVFLSTLAWGVWPGPGWLRRGGLSLCCAVVLAVSAAGLGSRLCPRLLLVGAFGCVVSMAMLMLFIGERIQPARGMRWVPMGLMGGLLFMDAWAWVGAWDQARNRFAGSDLADLPSAPGIFTARYQVYWDASHGSRLLDLTSAGAASLMDLPQRTQGVAIAPLRDRREQHLAVAAAMADVPIVVLEEHHCCQYPTTPACADQVVGALRNSGAVLVLPSASSSSDMVDGDNSWMMWLRQAAANQTGWDDGGMHWSTLRVEGMGGPLPCKPQYPVHMESRWPPPWPGGSVWSVGGNGELDRQGADGGADPTEPIDHRGGGPG